MEKNRKYLSGLSVWALSLGGVIGWGCFIMPGSTFLPDSGPAGAIGGIVAAAIFALIICINYSAMLKQYPEIGGSYVYTRHILGEDHAFLAVWCLLLAYLSLLWANATAFSLMIRYVIGSVFQWGFHYVIAGYDVYLGEVLMTLVFMTVLGLLTAYRSRAANILRNAAAVCLVVSILVIFICVIANNGLTFAFTPAFSEGESRSMQLLNVFILAPWMYVGFETVTHAVGESKFSVMKIFIYSGIAVVCGMFIYVMLTLVASSGAPAGYAGWFDYIRDIDSLNGIERIPVFYNTISAMGKWGPVFLGIATMSALSSSVLVFFRSAARVIRIMAKFGLLPEKYDRVSDEQVPVNAIILILVLSIPMPFLGRAVVAWNADVSTLTVAVVYAYISICTFRTVPKKSFLRFCGIAGAVISLLVLGLLLIPNVFANNTLSSESYFMLAIWSLIGIFYYRHIFSRDRENRFGKSTVMWLMMLLLLFISTNVWIRMLTESRLRKEYELPAHSVYSILRSGSMIQFIVVSIALAVIFNLFKTVIARQKEADMQALQAQEHDKAKSTFLSNMSHDIRTPMNAIVGMTDILLRENLPEHSREYVCDIKNSGERLLSIINDILDFSKIESGKLELEPEDYDFSQIMKELSFQFLTNIGGKPVELLYDISTGIPSKMRGDVKRISQIMDNLVGNAVKYTDYGFIKVSVEIKEFSGDTVVLLVSVTDSGRGIRQEDCEKIFESFYQVDTKKNRSIEGTGLGLAICQQLISMMGGTIGVESEYGKGSTFWFELPQTIVDKTPTVEINKKFSHLKGAYFFDNPYVTKNFLKLAKDLDLNVTQINSPEKHQAGDFDYFITEHFDVALYRHKDSGSTCNIACIQNPIYASFPEVPFTFINKPLYCRNLYAFLGGEPEKENITDDSLRFTAPDACALIVDDMPINLKVATGLFRPFGMQTDTAADGQEALDKIFANDYDIVFMDHMMPVMDGIEAVNVLRNRPEEKYRKLPVIALTANATVEARKLFTESGFSDFLAKPIDVDKLITCIKKWLPDDKIIENSTISLYREESGGTTEENDGITEESDGIAEENNDITEENDSGNNAPDNGNGISDTAKSVDKAKIAEISIPGIDIKKGIANSGGPAVFIELLGDVYGIIDDKCESIEQKLESNDIHGYTIDVHALKTTCRMIGAMELAERFAELEQAGIAYDLDVITKYTSDTLAGLRAIKPYLAPYAAQEVEKVAEFDAGKVTALLKELKEALGDFDLTKAEYYARNLMSYKFDDEIDIHVKRLNKLVSDLDYSKAAELCDRIAGLM